MPPTTLGKTLIRLREEAGMTVYGLAKETGIDRATLLRIERGDTTQPDVETLNALARALDIEAEVLYDAVWQDTGEALPSLPTYFRRKYRLSDQQIAYLQATVDRLTKRRKSSSKPKHQANKISTKERRLP